MQQSEDHEAILRYLDEHGVQRKDSAAPAAAGPRRARSRRSPHHQVDLHGLTEQHAERAIRSAVARCRETGKRSLLLIHGTGVHSDPADGPVLGALVLQMVEGELRALVRDHKKAPPRLGGDGATIVYLR